MRQHRFTRFSVALLVFSLLFSSLNLASLAAWRSAANPAETAAQQPGLSGLDSLSGSEGLSETEWISIDEQIRQVDYHFAYHEMTNDSLPYYWTSNRKHGYTLQFDQDGLRLRPDRAHPAWSFGFFLVGHTFNDQALELADRPQLAAQQARLEYSWAGHLTEWYVNSEDGLEHGFTLHTPPGRTGPTTAAWHGLRLQITGDLTPSLSPDQLSLILRDAQGAEILAYRSLKVWDATGRNLPARMQLTTREAGSVLELLVDAAGAHYPITVDPTLVNQANILTAFDGAVGDSFGDSIALDGDLLAVGKPDQPQFSVDSNGAGAVYLFRRNQGSADSWSLLKKLTASDGVEGDRYGSALDLHGDLLIVGARGVFPSQGNKAYLYTRNLGGANNYGELKKLHSATTLEVNSRFGSAVAIAADYAFVGAPEKDTGMGALYIFRRNQGGQDNWGYIMTRSPSNFALLQSFGASLDASGDAVVVGAPRYDVGDFTNTGSIYAFYRNQGGADNWGEFEQYFSPTNGVNHFFGAAVALDGNFLIVGEPGEKVVDNAGQGAAYIYERGETIPDRWRLQATLTSGDGAAGDRFGDSVAIHGDSAIVGANFKSQSDNVEQGAAYLFTRNRGGDSQWKENGRFLHQNGAAGDVFGSAVAISGDWLAAGAPGRTVNSNGDQGAVYLFRREQGFVYQGVTVIASDGSNNHKFGRAVALRGDLALIGAPFASSTGAAYLFERNSYNADGGSEQWDLVKKLVPSNGVSGDRFGDSVTLLENIAFVGAPFRNGANGAVYLYGRNQGSANNWGELGFQLSGDALVNEEEFGRSLAVEGDTLVIGAPNEPNSVPLVTGQGAVYIHRRNTGGTDAWGFAKKIAPGGVSDLTFFGLSVAISGSVIAAGAPGEDIGANDQQGAVYLFARNQGGLDAWGQIKKLTLSGGAALDRFGSAVSLTSPSYASGVMAIGAPGRTVSGQAGAGIALVHYQNQGGADQWGQARLINPSTPQAGANFGAAVALSGDRLLIGAPAPVGNGRAFLHQRNQNGADQWGETHQLAPELTFAIEFGAFLAMENDHLLIGAPSSTINSNANRGAAFIFHFSRGAWFPAGRLMNIPPSVDDQFATSVAVDGDWLAIGTPFDDFNSLSNPGSVLLFRRSSLRQWEFVKQLTAPAPVAEDQFGFSVSLKGDLLAVGAPFDEVSLANQGVVYLFSRNQGGANNWGNLKTLTANTPGSDDRFGFAVTLEKDTLVVGAPLDNVSFNDQGSVSIFSRNQGGTDNWGLQGTRTASDAAANDQFGYSLAIDGNTLAVGAPLKSLNSNLNQGGVYIFSRNNPSIESWGQTGAALTSSDGAATDRFGTSVALSGETLAVGAPFDDLASGSDHGSVYLFGRILPSGDVFAEHTKLVSPNPASSDIFGASLATNGVVLVVGAPGDRIGFAASQGAAFVFERGPGAAFSWGAVQELTDGDGAANFRLGAAVAISGDVIVVGAPDAIANNQSKGGLALVFISQAIKLFLPLIVR